MTEVFTHVYDHAQKLAVAISERENGSKVIMFQQNVNGTYKDRTFKLYADGTWEEL